VISPWNRYRATDDVAGAHADWAAVDARGPAGVVGVAEEQPARRCGRYLESDLLGLVRDDPDGAARGAVGAIRPRVAGLGRALDQHVARGIERGVAEERERALLGGRADAVQRGDVARARHEERPREGRSILVQTDRRAGLDLVDALARAG